MLGKKSRNKKRFCFFVFFSPSTTSLRRSPAHGAQYSLVVMKVAHRSNKRTRGPNEEAFQASVRRHLGQGRRRGGGARGDENWRIQLNFFHSRFFMCFLVKVATFTFGWRWPLSLSDFHFLSFVHFVILDCSSCIWNATDEGAIALKALVFVWNKCQNWDSQIGG